MSTSAQKNPYKILGVEKSASEMEIRRAYRNLAKKYHPDKHMSKKEEERKQMQEKFKELNAAYEILSDKKKREYYDMTGRYFDQAQQTPGGGFSGANFAFHRDADQSFGNGTMGGFGDGFTFSRVDEMFKGFGFGGSSGARTGEGAHARDAGRRAPAQNRKEEYKLGVTLEDISSGATKTLNITKKQRNGQQKKTKISVKIEPGYKAGTRITYPDVGDEHPDGSGTDLVVVLEEKPHSLFKRANADLIHEFPLSLKEALQGTFRKKIVSIRGTELTVNSSQLGSSFAGGVIKDEGLPDRQKGMARGNLILAPRLVMDLSPDELSQVQRAIQRR